MLSYTVAFFMIHLKRAKGAFAALIRDCRVFWSGLAKGSLPKMDWRKANLPCPSHSSGHRTFRVQKPEIAKCGTWSKAKMQRLCHMAHDAVRKATYGQSVFCTQTDTHDPI